MKWVDVPTWATEVQQDAPLERCYLCGFLMWLLLDLLCYKNSASMGMIKQVSVQWVVTQVVASPTLPTESNLSINFICTSDIAFCVVPTLPSKSLHLYCPCKCISILISRQLGRWPRCSCTRMRTQVWMPSTHIRMLLGVFAAPITPAQQVVEGGR